MPERGSNKEKPKSIREWLTFAFKVPEKGELSEEDIALLDKMADFLEKKSLMEAAILGMETIRPLNFVGAQALAFLRPFVHMVYKKKEEYDKFTELLENRHTLGQFVEILEARIARLSDNEKEEDKSV